MPSHVNAYSYLVICMFKTRAAAQAGVAVPDVSPHPMDLGNETQLDPTCDHDDDVAPSVPLLHVYIATLHVHVRIYVVLLRRQSAWGCCLLPALPLFLLVYLKLTSNSGHAVSYLACSFHVHCKYV